MNAESRKLPPGLVSAKTEVIAMAKTDAPQAMKLIKLAQEFYDFRVDAVRRDVVAVPNCGAGVALRLRGRDALSGQLQREYLKRHGGIPSKTALTSALEMLDAVAGDDEPITTYLRCARVDDDAVVIDLGTVDGQCVVVSKGRWALRARPPSGIVFRRTTVTSAMATPRRGGKLSQLRDLFALDAETWDLVRAWLVLAWLEDIPVPILGLLGPNGAGKSYLARVIVRLLDPAPVPLRRLPSKRADWPIMLNGNRVLALDNVSRMSLDVSDDISAAVTGAGTQNRQLYTDDDQIIFNYRRAFVLTSIDPGAMQGDFADRLMTVNMRRLIESDRREERVMEEHIARILPTLLGGLLSSVARVLANPVELQEMPRMADAARVMAAVDACATGSAALPAYRRSITTAIERVLESDPVAQVVMDFMDPKRRKKWDGTPTDLYEAIQKECYASLPERNWPANAQKLSERLMRISTALHEGKGLKVERSRGDERNLLISWNGTIR